MLGGRGGPAPLAPVPLPQSHEVEPGPAALLDEAERSASMLVDRSSGTVTVSPIKAVFSDDTKVGLSLESRIDLASDFGKLVVVS